MTRLTERPRSEAAEHLKIVARRLFAARGVDGVTVREIAEAAGQKNHAAVGYYFGSKDALIRELVVDGARLIDERRVAWLDRLEAEGGPHTVRQVVDAMVLCSIGLAGAGQEDSYTRFILLFSMSYRQTFMEALDGRWNAGYQRGLEHLRRLTPHLSAEQQNQRLVFMGACLAGVLSVREAELADASRDHPMWNSPATMDHFAHTLSAMLEAAAI